MTSWSNQWLATSQSYKVSVPAPHPLGIPTAIKWTSDGTTNHLGGANNIDGTRPAVGEDAPLMYRGVWVYVDAAGYKARLNNAGPWYQLSANTWTFIVSDGQKSNAFLRIDTVSGNALTTDTAWATGSIASDQPLPYFDGSTQPYPELVEKFLPVNFIPEGTTPIIPLTWVSAGKYFTASTTSSAGAFSYGTVGLTTSKSVASCEIRVTSEEYTGTKVQWQHAGAKFMDGDPLEVTTDWQKITSDIIPGRIVMGLRVTNFAPEKSKANFWIRNLTLNAVPTWSAQPPPYDENAVLYETWLVVYDNGQYAYTEPSLNTDWQAAKAEGERALYVANLAQQAAEGLITYMTTEEFNTAITDGYTGVDGSVIMVVDEVVDQNGDTQSNISAIYQWDGTEWGRYTLVTDTLIVAGPNGKGTYIQNGSVYSTELKGEVIDGKLIQANTLFGEKIIAGTLNKELLDKEGKDAIEAALDWNSVTITEPGKILLAANAPGNMSWDSTITNSAVSAISLEAKTGNASLNMYVSGQKVAYIDGQKSQMGIKRAVVEETIVVGEHQITSLGGGITAFNWVGKTVS